MNREELKEKKSRKVVVMLIRNKKGEILFARRSPSRKILPGIWTLPSGHIEDGEDFKKAAIREIKEELDIDTDKVELNQVIDEPSGDDAKVFVVDMPVALDSEMPKIPADDFDSLLWIRIEDFYKKFEDDQIGPTLRHLRQTYEKKQ